MILKSSQGFSDVLSGSYGSQRFSVLLSGLKGSQGFFEILSGSQEFTVVLRGSS